MNHFITKRRRYPRRIQILGARSRAGIRKRMQEEFKVSLYRVRLSSLFFWNRERHWIDRVRYRDVSIMQKARNDYVQHTRGT